MSIIQDLEDLLGIKYSDEQLKVLNSKGIGLCLKATAGSGKTTLLVHLLLKRVLSGEISSSSKVLLTSYSKASVDELNERLKVLFGKFNMVNSIECRTFHSLYLNIIDSMGTVVTIMDDTSRKLLLKKVIREVLNKDDMETLLTIETMLGYQVNNLLSAEDVVQYSSNTLNLDVETYTKIKDSFTNNKRIMGYIDYDDMQLLVYDWLVLKKHKPVIDYLVDNYSYVFIDEFQDISCIQYEILKVLLDRLDSSNIVVIGDPDQCIYEWRGAKPSLFMNICADYMLQTYNLGTNYRCGSNIVDFAYNSIKNNYLSTRQRNNRTMFGYNEGGTISITDGNSLHDISRKCVDEVVKLVDEGVDLRDCAILVRNIKSGTILNEMLSLAKIKVKATNSSLLLKDSVYYQHIGKLKAYLSDKHNNFSSLNLLVRNINAAFITCLENTVNGSDKSLNGVLYDLINNNTNLSYCIYRLREMYSRLTDKTREDLLALHNILLLKRDADCLLKLMVLYENSYISTKVKYNSSELTRLNRSVHSFMYGLISTVGLNYELHISTELCDDGIEISTIHGAKGKEWKHVIYFAVDSHTVPNINYLQDIYERDSKLLEKEVDAERRLNFVAVTRAKESLSIYYTDDLSVYIQESKDVSITRDNTFTKLLDKIKKED